jgi:hypothetical protein
MRGPGAQYPERELGQRGGERIAPAQRAPAGGDQDDRGIGMRARDRAEHGDQHEQYGAGGDGVAEQGDGIVSARQSLRHDP